ncbi:MAG: DUF4142 domain-containing protein [Armatimonadetes bacterium]|nr:DUF4142 domain-containing protein [Armatimonadota bacterium]
MNEHRLPAALALLAACALAATGAAAATSPDLHFMKGAAQGGMAEVALGKVAMQNGSNPNVKQFGRQMVIDHSEANHALRRIAVNEGVALPKGLGAKNDALKRKLSRLHGAAFDRAYVKAMVMDHEEDLAEFQRESNHGKDKRVKTFAGKYLPVIQGHLMMAQDMAKKGI